jgi:hypothetical protein
MEKVNKFVWFFNAIIETAQNTFDCAAQADHFDLFS